MTNTKLNIVFAGTPEFASESLKAIIAAGYNVIAVYTQPDRPAGRGKKLLKSAVKQVAEAHDIDVYQPEKLTDPDAQKELEQLSPDLMIVAAYGLLLPMEVLNIPKHGCVNIHASLLPRWRGAAPIQRAIQANDAETGITIMQMDKGLDTGDMLLKVTTPIYDSDTGGSLHDRLALLGCQAILDYLTQLTKNALTAEKQDDALACYAHKLSKQEAEICWQESAAEICLKIRAFNPWPIAFISLGKERIRVFDASRVDRNLDSQDNITPGTVLSKTKEGVIISCQQDAICIKKLQLPGGKAITAQEFVNGGKLLLEPGTCLHSEKPLNK